MGMIEDRLSSKVVTLLHMSGKWHSGCEGWKGQLWREIKICLLMKHSANFHMNAIRPKGAVCFKISDRQAILENPSPTLIINQNWAGCI